MTRCKIDNLAICETIQKLDEEQVQILSDAMEAVLISFECASDSTDTQPEYIIFDFVGGREISKFNGTILIVDDEENIRESFKSLFIEAGVPLRQIIMARTGAEAENIVKDRFISLAFIDIRLPDMDGLELLKKIKQKWFKTCCYVISGYGDKDNFFLAGHYGAKKFLEKPCNPDEIVAALDELKK